MIEFSNEEKEIIVTKIQAYFNAELNQEIGQFDAEFLMDFFTEKIGVLFYNRGLYDAQAILESRMDHLAEAITELEMPVK
ncbi:MAG: hypothetical protein ACI934_001414 [Pseudohongiellaceae bacterium]|jgi:uncharacterized protein (DUF2164 family)|nr:DUF2164 domain-containing protein [Gammaproteobacteria bacterium]MBT6043816.1 DUF2164 domain-containing protein [Gammaproteobacteria bacterium]MDA9909396.1 DUF2164 domain-containing protein [Gammaproteobacteria bacterium]|tara:strand:+ start:122 stop:361 length:240 start_codon:yes stop_codon:yes gene_type:complete